MKLQANVAHNTTEAVTGSHIQKTGRYSPENSPAIFIRGGAIFLLICKALLDEGMVFE